MKVKENKGIFYRENPVIRTCDAEPQFFPPVSLLHTPLGVSYTSGVMCWRWVAALHCLLSLVYYKTMSGSRLNFLVQVTLCWELWMSCSSFREHSPWGAAAHGSFSDSLQESCHCESRGTNTPLASWIHMRLVCRPCLVDHCQYSTGKKQRWQKNSNSSAVLFTRDKLNLLSNNNETTH